MTSIVRIFSPVISIISAYRAPPPGATTIPGFPFRNIGVANRVRAAKARAPLATAVDPRASTGLRSGAADASTRIRTSGSRSATIASMLPVRTALRNSTTTRRLVLNSAAGTTGWLRTRRRARLASCLAVSGVRPTTGAISSKGTSNTSCSTNATRSAGVSFSSTTNNARPTESATSSAC